MEKITKEKCFEIAKKYKYKMEFRKGDRKYYEFSKKHGFYNEITKHMKHKPRVKKYTEEEIKNVALSYDNRSDFKKDYPSYYNWVIANNKENEILKHLPRCGNQYKRCIYVYEFPKKTCYIGLTYNLKKRDYQHRNSTKSSVFLYCEENKIKIPNPKQLTDYINQTEASQKEIYFCEQYKQNGWNLLNKVKAGGLGGNRKEKLTKEYCKEIALLYKTRRELEINNKSVYNKIKKQKWESSCFKHMSKEYALKLKGEKISKSKIGKKMNILNYNNFRKAHSTVPVLQFDLEGNFLKEYYSANEAARDILGDSKYSNGILSVCNKKTKTYKGYIWKYKNENHKPKKYNYKKKSKGNSKQVLQFDLEGNFLKEYSSATDAALDITNKKSSAEFIRQCCRNKVSKAFGFIWKFKVMCNIIEGDCRNVSLQ